MKKEVQKNASNFIIIETTYSNLKEAKAMAKILLEKQLTSCVQLQKIESLFFWEEKIENKNEILLRIKSKISLYTLIEKTIKNHHSYKTPQIFSIQINQGFSPYLQWIEDCVLKKK